MGAGLLSIKLLGPPEVNLEGRNLRFGRKKALALLCYLAAKEGKRSRGELAGLLWPKSDQRRARTDLRSTLAGLRKAVGEDGHGLPVTHKDRLNDDLLTLRVGTIGQGGEASFGPLFPVCLSTLGVAPRHALATPP